MMGGGSMIVDPTGRTLAVVEDDERGDLGRSRPGGGPSWPNQLPRLRVTAARTSTRPSYAESDDPHP